MGIYSKELFTGPVGGEAPVTAAPIVATTSCCNHEAPTVQSAVVVTMIEGYIAFKAKNRTLTNLNEALDLVSSMTKDMVDNGELTPCQLEKIKAWVKEKSFMFMNGESPCKHKIMCKILENCCGCDDDSSAQSIKAFIEKKAEFIEAQNKVLQELGPSIQNAITQFINRYGKLMDETYLKSWS